MNCKHSSCNIKQNDITLNALYDKLLRVLRAVIVLLIYCVFVFNLLNIGYDFTMLKSFVSTSISSVIIRSNCPKPHIGRKRKINKCLTNSV